ncbi:MAG TPA: hypothetical protein PLA19_00170 [Candidatus Pacearchaeota archaeon]|jgi:hypothetical protein|nr:hypothetical protein [Candidatus Pacearchaeota archaeon]
MIYCKSKGGEKTAGEKSRSLLVAMVAIDLQKIMRDFARREGRLLELAGVNMKDREFVLDLVIDACNLMRRAANEGKEE